MNHPADIDPFAALSKQDFTILVRLNIGNISPFMWPAENRAGSDMLRRLLALALERSGVKVLSSAHAFELNHACFLFTTARWQFNLRELLAELDQFNLGAFATIAAFDPRELVIRSLHPDPYAPFKFPTHGEYQVEQALAEFEKHRCKTGQPSRLWRFWAVILRKLRAL